MKQRRKKVLFVARTMIGESGCQGLTMRKLSERAGVALGTLYKAFGNKDNLVTEAVADQFREVIGGLDEGPVEEHLLDILEQHFRTTEHAESEPEYSVAVVGIYFSVSQGLAARQTLHSMARQRHLRLLRTLRDRECLVDWADIDFIADEITSGIFSSLHSWAIGKIAKDALDIKFKQAFISNLYPYCRSKLAKEADTALKLQLQILKDRNAALASP